MVQKVWLNTLLGPPEYIISDPGTNFAAKEFRYRAQKASSKTIIQPVEAHHSIGKVERYHAPLRRAYDIISRELPKLPKRMRLQMAFKAINDSVGPNGLVPTLLVFGAFPRMSAEGAPTATIAERAAAVRSAMDEIKRLRSTRQVRSGLAQRNGPITAHLHNLPLNSEVLAWRDGKGWVKGVLVGMDGEMCQVNVDGHISNLRSTAIKPLQDPLPPIGEEKELEVEEAPLQNEGETAPNAEVEQQPPRRSVRFQSRQQQAPYEFPQIETSPDAEVPEDTIVVQMPDASLKNEVIEALFTESFADTQKVMVYITEKEERAREKSLELRARGIINTPGGQFVFSRRKEMDGLLA